jgi:hypothetical protein
MTKSRSAEEKATVMGRKLSKIPSLKGVPT